MHFNIIVLGSGAGSIIAHHSANKGLKTAIIDKGPFGGTCVNRGCIPSKMLIHPADLYRAMEKSQNLNLELPALPEWDGSSLVKRIESYTTKTAGNILAEDKELKNLTAFEAEAKFIGEKRLLCGDQEITGDQIYIAVGGRPSIPEIPGLAESPFFIPDDIFHTPQFPEKIIIIGGGFIAAEISHYLLCRGCDVTILSRSRYLDKLDPSLQSIARDVALKKMTLIEECSIESIENGKKVHTDKGIFESDALLVAAGITPNTDLLEVKNSSIECDEKGFIKVDDYLNTTTDGIYALGDCIPHPHFRHIANYQSRYLKETITGKATKPLEYPCIPYAIFTYPQIGVAGMTEQELKSKNIPFYTGKSPYAKGALGNIWQFEAGTVTLHFHKENDRLIGAHIIGEEASTLIHILIAYIQKNATISDIEETIFIHPTLGEMIASAAANARRNR